MQYTYQYSFIPEFLKPQNPGNPAMKIQVYEAVKPGF